MLSLTGTTALTGRACRIRSSLRPGGAADGEAVAGRAGPEPPRGLRSPASRLAPTTMAITAAAAAAGITNRDQAEGRGRRLRARATVRAQASSLTVDC